MELLPSPQVEAGDFPGIPKSAVTYNLLVRACDLSGACTPEYPSEYSGRAVHSLSVVAWHGAAVVN